MNLRTDILQRFAQGFTTVRAKYVSAALAILWIGLWQWWNVAPVHSPNPWTYLNGVGVGYTNSVILYYILQTILHPSYYYCYVKEHGIYLHFLVDTIFIVLPFNVFQASVCSYTTLFVYNITSWAYIASVYVMSEVVSSSVATYASSQSNHRPMTNSPHEVFHTIVSYLFTKLVKGKAT